MWHYRYTWKSSQQQCRTLCKKYFSASVVSTCVCTGLQKLWHPGLICLWHPFRPQGLTCGFNNLVVLAVRVEELLCWRRQGALNGVFQSMHDFIEVHLCKFCYKSREGFKICRLIPESLRWMILQKKMEPVKKLVQKITKFNNLPYPTEPMEAIISQDKVTAQKAKQYSFFHLLQTRELRKRSLVLFYLWYVKETETYIQCSFMFQVERGTSHFQLFWLM